VEIKPEDMAKIDVERLYWRGTSSDTFDGRRWRRSTEGYQPVRIDTYSGVLTLGREPSWKGRPISYRVFLEALNPPILFGADRLLRIVWDKPLIEKIFRGTININQDAYGGIYLSGTRVFAGDLTYSAESFLGQPPTDQLRKTGRRLALGLREPFLQLPTLDPEVLAVMKRMQGNRSAPYDTAMEIQQSLESHYRYTLNVQDTGVEDPLRFFLVDKKRGHCEYFSTALAIALRVAEIPSRHVVGYRGGEYNPYGGYVAVRQSDAHSWVEAYFAGAGWVRMDPSPLDSTIAFKKEYFKALNQFVDYLRLRWNKYIIEYDLRAQATLFETIGRRLFILAQRSSHDRGAATDGKPDAAERLERAPLPWILGGLVCCGVLWAVLRSEGRRRRKLGRLKGLLRILKRAGFEKAPAETPMELAQRVERKVGELKELQEAVRIYYDERFGARDSDTERWKTKLAALSAALRRRSTSRSL
jgi:transglutaminase-like putative cysteine protease